MKVSRMMNHGLVRWRVTWRSSGKTKRRFFSRQRDAKTFAGGISSQIKQFGEDWAGLDARDRAELVECWRKAKEKGYTIAEACRFWEANGSRTASQVTVGKLAQKFIEAKKAKLEPESLRLLETTVDQFKADWAKRRASQVTAEDLDRWIKGRDDWGPWRRRGVIIDLSNMFSWGVKAKLLLHNPMDAVERPKTPTKIKIFDVDQCKALLALCQTRPHRSLMPWLLISMFAGLRASEVERLTWGNVKDDHLELTKTKGLKRRLVAIRPVLGEWLKKYRKSEGPICPSNHRKKANRLRSDFGVWHKNVLRHTYISNEVARSENVDATALQAGNSRDTIFEHYLELVPKKEAKRFWELTPVKVAR